MTPGVLWNMIEAFNDGVALADGAGTLVLASRRLEKIFGYQHTELTGQPMERLIPAHLQAARARPVGTGVLLTGLRKDGTTFPVEVSLSPVPTPVGRFSLAVIRDMTAVRSLADLDAAAAADQVRRSQDLLDRSSPASTRSASACRPPPTCLATRPGRTSKKPCASSTTPSAGSATAHSPTPEDQGISCPRPRQRGGPRDTRPFLLSART